MKPTEKQLTSVLEKSSFGDVKELNDFLGYDIRRATGSELHGYVLNWRSGPDGIRERFGAPGVGRQNESGSGLDHGGVGSTSRAGSVDSRPGQVEESRPAAHVAATDHDGTLPDTLPASIRAAARRIYRARAGRPGYMAEPDGAPTLLSERDWLAREARYAVSPTPAELAEAKRQSDEIVARYTNPDGTRKPGWMKAPNGKPTRLTERQWVQVRTPNFRENFFGDWLSLALRDAIDSTSQIDFGNDVPADMAELVSLYKTGEEGDFKRVLEWAKKQVQRENTNRDIGKILTSGHSVRDILRHASRYNRGPLKVLVFRHLDEILTNAVLYGSERQGDKSKYFLAHRMRFEGKPFLARVTVEETKDGNRTYTVEFSDTTKWNETDAVATTREAPSEDSATSLRPSDTATLLRSLYAVNPSSVSKVVDENGEPRVMWRGAPFDPLSQAPGKGVIAAERYFTPSEAYARRYEKGAGATRAYFLNVRSPFDVRNARDAARMLELRGGHDFHVGSTGALDWAEAPTAEEIEELWPGEYDGLVLDEGGDPAESGPAYRGESVVPFAGGAQVKSTTDNTGVFSARPDVRYSVTPHGVQKQAGVAYPDASSEIVRFSIGAKRREEYAGLLARKRPDLDAEAVLAELDKFDEPKKEKIALHWVVRGGLQLPEDAYKIDDALDVAAKAKVDPFAYKSPDELLLAHKEFKPSARPIDPATVPELSDPRDEGDGIVSYEVQDDRQGQAAMRRVIDTHWGEDANPWCLLARNARDPDRLDSSSQINWGEVNDWFYSLPVEKRREITKDAYDPDDDSVPHPYTKSRDYLVSEAYFNENAGARDEMALENAWNYWQQYSALPKRVAFKNGKLLAFMATEDKGDDVVNLEDRLEELRSELRGERGMVETGNFARESEYWEAKENDDQATIDEIVNEWDEWVDSEAVSASYDDERGVATIRNYEGDSFFDEDENGNPREYRRRADGSYVFGGEAQEEWWDRKDESHPDLDWAREDGARYSVVALSDGTRLAAVTNLEEARKLDGSTDEKIEQYLLRHLEKNIPLLFGGTASITADSAKHFGWSRYPYRIKDTRHKRQFIRARKHAATIIRDILSLSRADAASQSKKDHHDRGDKYWHSRVPFAIPKFDPKTRTLVGATVYTGDVVIKDEGHGKYFYDLVDLAMDDALTGELTKQFDVFRVQFEREAQAGASEAGTAQALSATGGAQQPGILPQPAPEVNPPRASVAPVPSAFDPGRLPASMKWGTLHGHDGNIVGLVAMSRLVGKRLANDEISDLAQRLGVEMSAKEIKAAAQDLADSEIGALALGRAANGDMAGGMAILAGTAEPPSTDRELVDAAFRAGAKRGMAADAMRRKVTADVLAAQRGADLSEIVREFGFDVAIFAGLLAADYVSGKNRGDETYERLRRALHVEDAGTLAEARAYAREMAEVRRYGLAGRAEASVRDAAAQGGQGADAIFGDAPSPDWTAEDYARCPPIRLGNASGPHRILRK